jgi:hypothetical protein
MADDKHKKKKKLGAFCATRGCSENNYQEKCQGCSWRPGCQAHHILCCASVNKGLVATPKIKPILRQTKWCINAPHNMLAMPVWGATVKYYCTTRAFKVLPGGPPFANLPQHNWDHNIADGYTDEVTKMLRGLGQDIMAAKHASEEQDIAADLDDYTTHFHSQLNYRGGRKSGTDQAWKDAIASDGAVGTEWYLPFSMADDGLVRERGFPLKKNSSVATWIGRIANLLKG